jgi:hypothetical protein
MPTRREFCYFVAGAAIAEAANIYYNFRKQVSGLKEAARSRVQIFPQAKQDINDILVNESQQTKQTTETTEPNEYKTETEKPFLEKWIWAKGLESFLVHNGFPSAAQPKFANPSLKERLTPMEIYSKFHHAILPAGIELPINHKKPLDSNNLPTHPDYRFVKNMIAKVNSTEYLGYINLGIGYWSDGRFVKPEFGWNYSVQEIGLRAGLWKEMGVRKIFYDDCEEGFGVNKFRLAEGIKVAKDLDMQVAINSGQPDWLIKTDLLEDGFDVFIEPLKMANGRTKNELGQTYRDNNPFQEYKTNINIGVFAIATYDPNDPGSIKTVMDAVIPLAKAIEIDALCIAQPLYGSSADYDPDKVLMPILLTEVRN